MYAPFFSQARPRIIPDMRMFSGDGKPDCKTQMDYEDCEELFGDPTLASYVLLALAC